MLSMKYWQSFLDSLSTKDLTFSKRIAGFLKISSYSRTIGCKALYLLREYSVNIFSLYRTDTIKRRKK